MDRSIISKEKINKLISEYNALDYQARLIGLLKGTFPCKNFDAYSKFDLHKFLNEIVFANYKGEEIMKYRLFENHISKQNLIAAFEVKVNRSRVDFLTINGSTTSFEIKSELDNLTKLRKQCDDYLLAFEYNYVVVHSRHLHKSLETIPESFGIWCFENDTISRLRKARLNNKIRPEAQLRQMTKMERKKGFKNSEGMVNEILDLYSPRSINNQFKVALKNRYAERWSFMVSNKKEILPMDIQFFF